MMWSRFVKGTASAVPNEPSPWGVCLLKDYINAKMP